MLQWPDSRGGQYALVLTIAGLVVAGRVGLQSDDLRAFLNALELVWGVPLGAYGVVAGTAAVQRTTRSVTHRLDRLLGERTDAAGAETPRLHGVHDEEID